MPYVVVEVVYVVWAHAAVVVVFDPVVDIGAAVVVVAEV